MSVAQKSGSVDIQTMNLTQQIELQKAQQVKNELARTRVELRRAESEKKASQERLDDFKTDGIEVPKEELEVLVAADPEARLIMDEITALESGIQEAGKLAKPQMTDGSFGGVAVGHARQRVNELMLKLDTIRDRLSRTWKVDQLRALDDLDCRQGPAEEFTEHAGN